MRISKKEKSDFYKELGSRGGKKTAESRGASYMSKIGKKGARKRLETLKLRNQLRPQQ